MTEDLLERAFQLAFFIHHEHETAKRIAFAAVGKLEAAALAQDKRLYYPPSGGARSKVSMTELHLLQRLVFSESESFEKQKEDAGALSRENLLVHFLKHLVKITVRRNSLYVALGVCRVLHQYSTAETMELHNVIVQDPERAPNDYYYRLGKGKLMRELKERFGALLRTTRGVRGEERFETQATTERFRAVAGAALARFAPWDTLCPLPLNFDPRGAVLPALCFAGGDPDAEHEIEVSRFHALLAPECFERLVKGMGYELPAVRLAVPRFYLIGSNTDSDDSSGDSGGAPHLAAEEREELRRQLAEQARRRRKFSTAGLLRFVADGVEQGRLDLRADAHARFHLPADAEFLEVYAREAEGELLLAVQPLAYGADGQLTSQRAAFTLAGGQQLDFAIEPLRDAEGEVTGAAVECRYRETHALALSWRRLLTRLTTGADGWLRPALSFGLLAALGVGLAWVLLVKPRREEDIAQHATPTPLLSPTPAPQASSLPSPTVSARPTATVALPSNQVIAWNVPAKPDEARTRSNDSAGLLDAKKVYLQLDIVGKRLRQTGEQVRRRLATIERLSLTSNIDEADSGLKIMLEPVPNAPAHLSLTARLIDLKENVLWPAEPKAAARKYVGPAEKVIETFSRELAADWRRLEERRK